MDAAKLTYEDAITMLQNYAYWARRRDEIMRQAFAAGVSKTDIARHMNVARSTVSYVLLDKP